jgi:hypothetical protein
MPSTFTSGLHLEKQATGENENTWGGLLNNVLDQIDRAVAGVASVSISGSDDTTLTSSQSENHFIQFIADLSDNVAVIIPNETRNYILLNATTGSFTLTIKTAAGTGVIIPQGQYALVYCNGTDSFEIPIAYTDRDQTLTNKVITAPVIGTILTLTATGTATTTGTLALPIGISDTIVTRTSTETLTNKTISLSTLSVADTGFTIVDDADASKKFQMNVTAITTATTRTWAVPDFSDTYVGLTGTQTITNKTLDGGSNTLSGLNASNLASGTIPGDRYSTSANAYGTRYVGSGAPGAGTGTNGDMYYQIG